MNTVVAGVGPFCSGKSTILNFIQTKFSEKVNAKLVFPKHDRSELKAIKKKRNTALDDPYMTYKYLTHVIQYSAIQYSANIASTAFRDLSPRSVLFLEQSPEYIEIVVKAALRARFISKYQWTLLRILLDEVAVANVMDIFISFSNEEYDE